MLHARILEKSTCAFLSTSHLVLIYNVQWRSKSCLSKLQSSLVCMHAIKLWMMVMQNALLGHNPFFHTSLSIQFCTIHEWSISKQDRTSFILIGNRQVCIAQSDSTGRQSSTAILYTEFCLSLPPTPLNTRTWTTSKTNMLNLAI